jgi:hypothetical protein
VYIFLDIVMLLLVVFGLGAALVGRDATSGLIIFRTIPAWVLPCPATGPSDETGKVYHVRGTI